ncbi:hypothetical protein [Brachybacterium sp. J153]|uniref:hypothetical protein n=1 Tax=Brachybacterium sp. J153 TaxID=3116488 RepID=UPI002E764379|nr:hypothetical protein [Brachybacterium sp. J153]MEE1616918.1 hypothetical protein [Brachybacterium sp. J153]
MADDPHLDRLLDDLSGRLAHQEREEMLAVSEDLARAERAQLTLADRLRASLDRPVVLQLSESLRLSGRVEEVSSSWMTLREDGAGRASLVPLTAIVLLEGLSARARPLEESALAPRGLGAMLRGMARDRATVRVETRSGGITGRIADVGAELIDVVSLPTGERSSVPGSSRLSVVLSSILAVRPR